MYQLKTKCKINHNNRLFLYYLYNFDIVKTVWLLKSTQLSRTLIFDWNYFWYYNIFVELVFDMILPSSPQKWTLKQPAL